MTIAQ
ncbi:Protein of unknown function [Propionibacterium freudenreichii subsp. freudenreichii]|jgi:hypothetical protein